MTAESFEPKQRALITACEKQPPIDITAEVGELLIQAPAPVVLPGRHETHVLAFIAMPVDDSSTTERFLGEILRQTFTDEEKLEFPIAFFDGRNDTLHFEDSIPKLVASVEHLIHPKDQCKPDYQLPDEGSLGLIVDLGPDFLDEAREFNLQLSATRIVDSLKRDYRITSTTLLSQGLIVIIPPRAFGVHQPGSDSTRGIHWPPQAGINHRIVSYKLSPLYAFSGDPSSTPQAMIWVNPRGGTSGQVKAVMWLDPRVDEFEPDPIMEVLGFQGSLKKVVRSLTLLTREENSTDVLRNAAAAIGELQNKIDTKSLTNEIYNSELIQFIIELFANKQFIERLLFRVATLVQINLLEKQNEILKTQQEAKSTQDQANERSERFKAIAATIAAVVSTTGLFAGLAAIPSTRSDTLLPALNLAITIVSTGAFISFLIFMRNDFTTKNGGNSRVLIAIAFVLLVAVGGWFLYCNPSRINRLIIVVQIVSMLLTAFLLAGVHGGREPAGRANRGSGS